MNAKLVSPIIIFCGYNIVPKHIAEFVAPRHSLACDVSFMGRNDPFPCIVQTLQISNFASM